MIEAYCKAVGISYSPDLLTWEAGDEAMTNQWMVPKETILTFKLFAAHANTFKCTGFHKQDMKNTQTLNELPFYMQPLVEEEMPYYEKLYAERLICN